MKRVCLLYAAILCGTTAFGQDEAHPAGWVVIPVNEYGALHGRAYPPDRRPETGPPVEATLTRVDYDLKLDGGIAAGRASLTVDVLKDGWVRVPIPPGLLVREARLGGQLVSLVPTGGKDGHLAAILSHKGRSVLDLDVAFTVVGSRGEERLSLPAGASGVTRASVTRAAQDAEVHVNGGFVTEQSSTCWLAYARGNEPLVFTWARKVEEQQPRASLPLRMRGSLTQLFSSGEDSTSLNADVGIDVLQGVTRQVRVTVPDTVTINQVPGATVADWDVKGGLLVVNFLEPVDRSAKFTISGETHLAREGEIDLPLLRLVGTERDTGGAAIEVLGAGEIKDSKAQGLDPVEAAELGPMVAARQSPSLAAFRLRAGAVAPTLHVNVVRYAQQAVLTANVEEARYRVLMSGDGKTLVQARYAVRNNQRTFMRITLPQGAMVWSSSLAGRPVHPGKDPSGSLLFPLAKGRAGEEAPAFAIEIQYLVRGSGWSPKGRAALLLPVLDLPVSRTGVTLYYPPQFRVTPESGAFREQSYEPPVTDVWSAPAAPSPLILAPSAVQALVDSYRARTDSHKTAAALPVRIEFPAVGPSLYLVSELTAESQGALVEVNYQKEKKGGVK